MEIKTKVCNSLGPNWLTRSDLKQNKVIHHALSIVEGKIPSQTPDHFELYSKALRLHNLVLF